MGNSTENTWECGDNGSNVVATLDGDDVLLVEGNGGMVISDFGQDEVPDWRLAEKVIIRDGITSVAKGAFRYCFGLTSMVIPASVMSFNCSFKDCPNLRSIKVDGNNPNYCSVDDVLFNKNKTTLVRYPPNKAEQHYTIPKTVTVIAEYAFYDCKNLTAIDIPDTVVRIERGAFSGSAIKSVHIGNNVISVEDHAFEDCENIADITISNHTTHIGELAFFGCGSGQDVDMFSVTCLCFTPPTLGKDAFGISKEKFSLRVPKGCRKYYEKDPLWEKLAFEIKEI